MNRGIKILIGVGICLFSQLVLAEGVHDGVSAPKRPSSEATSNGLVPAGVGGSPSFQILMLPASGYGPANACQGSLVSYDPEKEQCGATTAMHCLDQPILESPRRGVISNLLNKTGCAEDLRDKKVVWGEVKIQTANFGTVKATAFINPFFKRPPNELPPFDAAYFSFSCPGGPGQVPVLEVDSGPLQPYEEIRYTKTMEQPGIYSGHVMGKSVQGKTPDGRITVQYPRLGSHSDYISEGSPQTIPGDSGGLGLVKRDGKWKIGALNSGEGAFSTYTSGKSLEFVACMAGGSGTDVNNTSGSGSVNPLQTSPLAAGLTPAKKSPSQAIAAQGTPQRHEFLGSGRGDSRRLHLLRSSSEEPSPRNAVYLKRMPDGSRKAAIKDANGQVVILDDKTQRELRQYYESHRNKLDKLSADKRSFVDGFLSGFSSGSEIHGDNNSAPTDTPQSPSSQGQFGFECVSSEGGFRPKKSGGNYKLLGAIAFKDKAQCEKAVANARNGVVCSATEEGFKATHHSGSVAWEEFAGTKPFGYLGGESLSLEDCLETTLKSTSKAICYRSASTWLAGDINGTGKLSSGISRGPYESLSKCVAGLDPSSQEPQVKQPPIQSPQARAQAPTPTNRSPQAQQAIDFYERGMKYGDGTPREYFPKDTFTDIPKGGTGQIILAYFGPKDQALEDAGKRHPLIDVRNYPFGSPEHRHAQLFRVQALGLDGLGRKITRYAMSPREAFNSLASSNEVEHLRRYLEAKNSINQATEPLPTPKPGSRAISSDPPRQEHPPVEGHDISAILEGNCIQCHQSTQGLDSSLKNTSGLLEHLRSATDGTLEDMAERAGISTEQLNKLKAFRDQNSSGGNQNEHGGGGYSSARNPSQVGQARPRELTQNDAINACYMSDTDRRARIQALPEFATSGSPIAASVNSALNQGKAIFYDKESVPVTWQQGYAAVGGPESNRYSGGALFSPQHHFNVSSYNKNGYHADGAREFPWHKPAGTDASGDTIASEKFFVPGGSGQLASLIKRTRQNSPAHFGRSTSPHDQQVGWKFETGATFGEVLKVTDPESGEAIPFEVRLRRKNEQGVWQMDVLRPFENASDLVSGLKKLCVESSNPPAGCAQIAWSKLEKPDVRVFNREQFVNRQSLGTRLDPLKLSSTAASALNQKASLQVLPDMPPDVVRALLKTTPFKSVFGKPWTQGENGAPEGWAPTSNSAFNIVPQNYFGGFIPMNQVSCMKCHESAGRSVDHFDPVKDVAAGIKPDRDDNPNRSRTWYNFIPGNDGIISFHPWDAQKATRGGKADLSSLNDCLRQAGLLK